MAHPTTIPGYTGTLQQMGVDQNKLRYDALLVVLDSLATEMYREAGLEGQKGKKNLARELGEAYCNLAEARRSLQRALVISRKYMHEEFAVVPEIMDGQLYGY